MDFRKRVAFGAALAILAAAALGATTDRSAAEPAREGAATKAGRLVAFGGCPDLLRYAKSQATRFVGPYGLGGGPFVVNDVAASGAREAAPPKQGVDFSGTNVQEEGVDEPDIVKTNGNTLFAVANGKLNAVDVRTAKPQLLDTLKLDPNRGYELLLHERSAAPPLARRLLGRAAARDGRADDAVPGRRIRPDRDRRLQATGAARRPHADSRRRVRRCAARRRQRAGSSSRRRCRPRSRSYSPRAARRKSWPPPASATSAVVASSRVGSWLPSYQVKRAGSKATKKRALVQCRHVKRPVGFSGLGMLTVLTVDLAKGIEPTDSVAVMTDGRIVYASPESLYVATERWADRPTPEKPTQEKDGVKTTIHKFDISSPARTQYRGSGEVSGYLLSQWSLSEHNGVLRVVSTEQPAWWGPAGGESESFLTTLRHRDGALVQAGRVGGLGKGERVYSIRFVGDVGYVVTFRQIDPLYTIDLSVPERPRVLGELKIPGYSAYLHPVGEDLLLGIGQDATEEGRPTGTQLSLFDVSDLRKPTRLHSQPLGPGWSEAESDHHAFLFWPQTGLVVIPFEQRAVGYRVGRARGISAVGKIDHEAGKLTYAPGVRRSLVVRSAVLTVSDAGVKSSSLATLAELGWAAFPPPEQRRNPGRSRKSSPHRVSSVV